MATNQTRSRSITADDIKFAVATVLFALLAHALAYLMHEYTHGVFAWALGWMTNPFGIDYGPPTLHNVIFLNKVSDNVNYDPIIASGHGASAAIIALSGAFIGNGAVYFLLYRLMLGSVAKQRKALTSFVYWLSLMSAANVWSYVPIRALATHADIAIAAKGLNISTLVLFPFLIVPALYIVYHFFTKTFPLVYALISSNRQPHLAMIIAFTAFWYFSFFGNDGLYGDYGLFSQLLSITSCYLLFPLAVVFLSSRYSRSADHLADASQ